MNKQEIQKQHKKEHQHKDINTRSSTQGHHNNTTTSAQQLTSAQEHQQERVQHLKRLKTNHMYTILVVFKRKIQHYKNMTNTRAPTSTTTYSANLFHIRPK